MNTLPNIFHVLFFFFFPVWVCFRLLSVFTYCLRVAFGGLSGTSICHGDNRTQLKEIRCCDVSGRSPAAAGWCCFWPRPHSSADYTAQAQLVGWRSVCLSVRTHPPTLHPNPRPPAAPPHPSHHLQLTLTGRHAAQLSYRKWGKKKIKNCWSILWRHHAIIASSLRTIRTHTHTKECMQAKRGLQHTKGMTPTTSSRSLCGGETVCFHVNHQY